MSLRERAEKLALDILPPCDRTLYIADIEAFAREIEAETIERCWDVADNYAQHAHPGDSMAAGFKIADKIRALKTDPNACVNYENTK